MTVRRENLLYLAAALAGVTSAGVTASRVREFFEADDFDPRECDTITNDGGTLRGVRYLERMRNADPDDRVPMVVLFHSRGATPEGHKGMLQGLGPSRLIVPEGALSSGYGRGRLWWERGVTSAMKDDPAAAAAQWRAAAARMHVFLRTLVRCRPTQGKPILTGSSMGGQMAYLMGTRYADHAYAAVAVNGYLLPELWSPHMVPTLALHGVDDRTVPFDWDAEYVAAMQAQGAPITLQPFAAGHNVTAPMARTWIDAVASLTRTAAAAEPPRFDAPA